jgi:hypothetical protein
LLYYGVLALSRALILTLEPRITENTLKGSHGWKVKNWPFVLKSKAFEDLELEFVGGSISELLIATGNDNYLRAGTNMVNWKSHLSPPSTGQVIRLKEFFHFLPDLSLEYYKWVGSSLPHAIISSIKRNEESGLVEVKMNRHNVDEGLLEHLFPIEYAKSRYISFDESYAFVTYQNLNWAPNITQKWDGPFGLGDTCVVPVLRNDVGFNVLGTMFSISYAFGMMARYYPSSWISLRRLEKGDKAYPLIQKTLKFIEEKYPLAVLDFLKSPYEFESK